MAVVVSLGKVGLGLQWEEFAGSAQLDVISLMYLKVSPPLGEGAVLKVGRMLVFLVLALVGLGLKKGCKVEVVLAAGPKGVEKPLPPGRVLSQREQALGALDALIQVLGPVAGPQVQGLVEGLLPQKPASPVPTTPTHAEVVARLHEHYDSEKKGKKVEEAQGRLETARAQVLQAEEGMTRADGELQVIQNQIKALLREEEERKERRQKEDDAGGEDMEDTTLAEEGSSEDVGFGEIGKRRKVATQGSFWRARELGYWQAGCRRGHSSTASFSQKRIEGGASGLLLYIVTNICQGFLMRIQVERLP